MSELGNEPNLKESSPLGTGTENPAPPPDATQRKRVSRAKILGMAVAAIVVVVGLYFVNHVWIAPVAMRQAQAKANSNHPVAPAFTLTDIFGKQLSLSEYKGKVVMLDFWATWCGPCRIEIPGFVELQDRYRDQGFTIIGISLDDSSEPVMEFYKQFKMNYPVAVGNDSLGALYGGIFGMPTTFLIGRDGRIYSKHVGATHVGVFEEEVKVLLAAKPSEELTDFTPAGRGEEIETSTPEQLKAENNPDVPGVDIHELSAQQLAQFKSELQSQQCTCGCNLNLLKCRHDDRGCAVSRKAAQQILKTRYAGSQHI
jgi:cytochrome c biogenesis protein CcmG, thiol:disulfide interchange protein DsbE